MAYSGKYKPQNPQKYIGDHNNIIYRSSWECKFMAYLDTAPHVVAWGSEEVVIPYKSPVDGKFHRYFTDFIVKSRTKDGKLKTMLIEIKPKKQTLPPEPQKRKTKQYINEVVTWGVNCAKWQAANEYCLDKGWEFKILTEQELNI
jgi:hypothetical protein